MTTQPSGTPALVKATFALWMATAVWTIWTFDWRPAAIGFVLFITAAILTPSRGETPPR